MYMVVNNVTNKFHYRNLYRPVKRSEELEAAWCRSLGGAYDQYGFSNYASVALSFERPKHNYTYPYMYVTSFGGPTTYVSLYFQAIIRKNANTNHA